MDFYIELYSLERGMHMETYHFNMDKCSSFKRSSSTVGHRQQNVDDRNKSKCDKRKKRNRNKA